MTIKRYFHLSFHLITPSFVCIIVVFLEKIYCQLFIIATMAPKRSCTIESSPPTILKPSQPNSKKQTSNFKCYYANRDIFESHYLDEQLFKDYNFVQDFIEYGLPNLVFEIPQEISPTLVRLFYADLKYVGGILRSKVKKYQIHLTPKELTQICNLIWSIKVRVWQPSMDKACHML